MSLVDVLNKHFDEIGIPRREPIEDQVAACVDAVMLDVEHTPVIEKPGSAEPTEVTKRADGTYALTYRNVCDLSRVVYEDVTEADLKIMRARYLVTRGALYKRLPSMGREERNRTLHNFFPGGVWTPREGSTLAAGMGMETREGLVDKGPKQAGE